MTEWRNLAVKLCFLAGLTVVFSCSSGKTADHQGYKSDASGDRIAALAREQIGAPYRYGGESPAGFDCSGLVRYVYRQLGINVPHSSKLLHRHSRKIRTGKVSPGDLLFFRISSNKISHVGIYIDKGQFVHAPSSGKQVSLARLDNPYWRKRLVGAGRIH